MGKRIKRSEEASSLLYDTKTDESIVLELTKKVYHPDNLVTGDIDIEIHKNKICSLVCEKYINDNISYMNGLQAGLYKLKDNNKVYLVIRGADVGAGKKIFHIFNANDKFIPKSIEENSWRTLYQDWIYSTLLGSLGIVKLFQYNSLKKFFLEVKKEYPECELIVGGHSLGGLLAQRLYLQEEGISKCITFSGLSPWWTLNSQSQDILKKYNFLESSESMVNFYSDHDPARYYPLFSRYLGKQNNVLLEPFQSRSNILATFLERIYWAHIPNYYIFKDNKIKLKESDSKLSKIYDLLNVKIKYNFLINVVLVILLTVILNVFLLATDVGNIVSLLTQYSILDNVILNRIFITLVTLIIVSLLMLPGLIVKSKWKIVIVILNITLVYILPLWPLLLIFSIVLNRIYMEEVYE